MNFVRHLNRPLTASKHVLGTKCSGGAMDQGYKAGGVDPEAIAGSVKSVVQNHVENQLARQEANGRNPNWAAYPAADLFGRCFLRVCLWVDAFTSWTRRGELLAYQGPKKSIDSATRVDIDSAARVGKRLPAIPAEVAVRTPTPQLSSTPPS
jgi:hypothetical protein